MFQIKTTQESGRGLYATKIISQGTIITSCELLVLSPEDTPKVNETDLQYYTFVYNEKQDCLVLGLGEIFNHSDTANIKYSLIDFEGRKLMQFVAACDIGLGQELCIDYSADTKVNTEKYIKNPSLL